MKLSICMISRTDDLHLLPNTLSTCPAGAEIIIVETVPGETEAFEAVAERENIKHWKWTYTGTFHFGNARNKTLELATGDWILSLDTDDYLSDLERRWIAEVLPELHEQENIGAVMCYCSGILHFDGYNIKELASIPGIPSDTLGYWVVPTVRLFRRGSHLNWVGRIHEQIMGSVINGGYDLSMSEFNVRHRGYRGTLEHWQAKMERNLKLLKQQLEEDDIYKKEYTEYLIGTQMSLDALYAFKELHRHEALQTEP